MKDHKMIDSRGTLLDEGAKQILSKATDVSCECPEHLIQILSSIKAFTKYQESCITEKPNDTLVHDWLKSTSINLEHFVSSAILHLARIEGIIDEDNKLVD